MFSRASLLAVVLAFGLVSGLSITLKLSPSKLKLPTNKKVLGLQQQTEVLAAQNPVSSKSCFDYYIPVLNSVTIQYEVAYAQCQKNYDTASDLVLKSWNSTLYGIQAAGDSGCTTFFDCSSIVDYVQAFECFADVGAEQAKTMYQVSANATEAGSSIKIHLQTLDTQQESCNNNADRSYVENTAYTYEGLNQCLSGAPIPEDSPSHRVSPVFPQLEEMFDDIGASINGGYPPIHPLTCPHPTKKKVKIEGSVAVQVYENHKRFIAQPVSAAMQSSPTQEPGDLGPEIMITELNRTELN
nr:uncharacterized protein LOC108010729 [Drosophila suzukii]